MGVSQNKEKAKAYLGLICGAGPDRRSGSAGCRAVADLFAGKFAEWGYEMDATPFDCMDFETGVSSLVRNGEQFQVFAGPFSTGCEVTAETKIASTVDELKKCRCKGKILLLKGELCAEHLMPKNYPFYYPDHHRAIIELLEKKKPAAIVAATGKNPALAGAIYPYPLIEDAAFDIPSAYCTDVTGEMIAAAAGGEFRLAIEAKRIPTKASNVVAHKNTGARRKIVVCAHFDTKPGTPGALDNGAGAVTLLLLAEMLKDYEGSTGIELLAVSTEEHYSAAGELDYLRRYGGEMGRVVLAVNIDGLGYLKGKTAYSLYGCPAAVEKKAREAFDSCSGMVAGPQWPAGDHMVFVMNGRPAIAITSEKAEVLGMEIIHTPDDTPDLVDCGKLVDAAAALREMITGLDGRSR